MTDNIDELVDWQLANRRPVDIIVSVCRICLNQWIDSAVVTCPKCGVLQ